MHIVWAGLLLGVAAVWGVPIVGAALNWVLSNFPSVQSKVQPYLPSSQVPGVTVQSVVTAILYGVILGFLLHLLRQVGLKSAKA